MEKNCMEGKYSYTQHFLYNSLYDQVLIFARRAHLCKARVPPIFRVSGATDPHNDEADV